MTNSSASPFPILELLESKLAPAGIVSVEYNAVTNNLVITGDGEGNEFTMTQTALDSWRFTGQDGTQFSLNGAAPAGSINNLDILKNTKILLGDGDDKLTINADAGAPPLILEGIFEIQGGVGNDDVLIGDDGSEVMLFQGATKFEQGAGSGEFVIKSTAHFSQKVTYKSLGGGLFGLTGDANAIQTFTKGLSLDLGTISGSFFSSGTLLITGGKLDIKAAGSHAQVLIGGPEVYIDDGLSVKLTTMASTIQLGGSLSSVQIGGPVTLSTATGAGADNINIAGDVRISGAFTADMKEGVNQVTLDMDTDFSATSVLLKGGKQGLEVEMENDSSIVTSGSLTIDVKTAAQGPSLFELRNGATITVGSHFNYLGGVNQEVLALDPGAGLHVSGNLTLTLGAGTNVFVLNGNSSVSVGGNLTMTTLAGDDIFTTPYNIASQLTVLGTATFNLGAGNNLMDLEGVTQVGGNFSVISGAGNDSITLGRNNFILGRNLTLNLGDGNNEFRLAGLTTELGAFSYTGGKGLDILTIGLTEFFDPGAVIMRGNATIKTGAGTNRINIGFSTLHGAVNIQSTSLANEADFLNLMRVTLNGALTASLGKGGSVLAVDDSTVNAVFNVNTGDGEDLVRLDNQDNALNNNASGVNRWNSTLKILSGKGQDTFLLGTGADVANPSASKRNIFRTFSTVLDGGADVDNLQQTGNRSLSGSEFTIDLLNP